jgi:magnesium transporter
VVVLALFIPVVLALAESVSIQSVTLTLQGLHNAPRGRRVFVRGFLRELQTALLLGASCGAIVGGSGRGRATRRLRPSSPAASKRR